MCITKEGLEEPGSTVTFVGELAPLSTALNPDFVSM